MCVFKQCLFSIYNQCDVLSDINVQDIDRLNIIFLRSKIQVFSLGITFEVIDIEISF